MGGGGDGGAACPPCRERQIIKAAPPAITRMPITAKASKKSNSGPPIPIIAKIGFILSKLSAIQSLHPFQKKSAPKVTGFLNPRLWKGIQAGCSFFLFRDKANLNTFVHRSRDPL
jgi:hypothetical protein